MKIKKTNAARILDRENIDYELLAYAVDKNDLSAKALAEKHNLNIEQIFKTIVLTGNINEYFVCLVPGNKEIDFKKAAQVSQNKNSKLIPLKDLFKITGYIRGACSPLGMKNKFPSFLEKSALDFDCIYINAGAQGLQFKISPKELIKALDIQVADLC